MTPSKPNLHSGLPKVVKSLADLNARICFVVLTAPKNFQPEWPFGTDQTENLLIAFEILYQGLPLAQRKVKNPEMAVKLSSLFEDALEAYQRGDKRTGAWLLQDFQDIVWPGRFKSNASTKPK